MNENVIRDLLRKIQVEGTDSSSATLLNLTIASCISSDTLLSKKACEKSLSQLKLILSVLNEPETSLILRNYYIKVVENGIKIVERDKNLF